MLIRVLSYDSLGELVTVELHASSRGSDGVDLPLKFMGRTSVPRPPSGYGELADEIFQLSQTLAQMAMDLSDFSGQVTAPA